MILSPIYNSSQLVLKRYNIDHIFEVSRIVIYAAFYLFLGTKLALQMHFNSIMMYFRGYPKTVLGRFLISNLKIVFVLEKFQLCTIIRSRTDQRLGAVSTIFRNDMALQVCLCDATLCHKDYPRILLTVFLSQV